MAGAEYEVNIKINTKDVKTQLGEVDKLVQNIGKPKRGSKASGLGLMPNDELKRLQQSKIYLGQSVQSINTLVKIQERRARSLNKINEIEAKGLNVDKLRKQLGKATTEQSNRRFGSAEKEFGILEKSIRLEQSKLRILKEQQKNFPSSPIGGGLGFPGSPKFLAGATASRTPFGPSFPTGGASLPVRGGAQYANSPIARGVELRTRNVQVAWGKALEQLGDAARTITTRNRNINQSWGKALEQLGDTARTITTRNRNINQSWGKALGQLKETAGIISTKNAKIKQNWIKALGQLDDTAKTITQNRKTSSKKRFNKRAGDVALGAGFPLLFGGGLGSVLGGAAGGALGGGLAGQIGLSALGQQFDKFGESIRNLSDKFAESSDILGNLKESGIQVNSSLINVVNTLKEQGRFTEAYNLELRELEKRFGPGAQTMLSEYNLANQRLGNEFSRLTTELQSYAIPALTLFTNIIARIASIIPDIPTIAGFGVSTAFGPAAGFATQQAMRAGESAGSVQTNMFGFVGATDSDRERLAKARGQHLEEEKRNEARIKEINSNQLKIARARSKEADSRLSLLKAELDLKQAQLEIDISMDRFTRQQELRQATARVGGKQAMQTINQKQASAFLELARLGKSPSDADTIFGLSQTLLDVEIQQINEQARQFAIALSDAGMSTERVLKITKEYKTTLGALAKEEATQRLANFETIEQAAAKTLKGLQDEQNLLKARLEGGLEEELLEQRVNAIMENKKGLTKESVEDILRGTAALEEQVQALEKLDSMYAAIGQSISSGIVDALSAAVEGTKSLADIASQTLKQIANILLQFGVNSLLGSLGGNDNVGFFSKLFPQRAKGGPVSGNQPYLVGERGPELFVPGAQGNIVPNHAMGGGANVTVNVDASGSKVQGSQADGKALGSAIGAAVQAELIKQKRPGGLLAG